MSNLRLVNGIQKSYLPGYGADTNTPAYITVDDQNVLRTRGAVMTDEGGYTTNFSVSASSLGACTFTSGSNVVKGSGFSSLDLYFGDYVKYDGDPTSKYTPIVSFTDTELYLIEPYTGTGGTGGTGWYTTEKTKIGVGGDILFTLGIATISAGVTAGAVFEIERDVDILPLVIEKEIMISNRIAGQSIYLGVYDDISTESRFWAWFQFTGTSNSTVITETAFNRGGAPTAYDKETYTVQLPNQSNTSVFNRYRVEVTSDNVRFLINDTIVSTHKKSILRPNSFMTSCLRVVNETTVASNTNVTINWSRAYNYNKLSVGFMDHDSFLFSPDIPKEYDSCMPVRVAPQKTWRTTFSKTLSAGVDGSNFNLIRTGTGNAVKQSLGALNFITGTTVNSESIVRSNRTWADSWMLKANVNTSAATGRSTSTGSLFIEMVDVIGDNLPFTYSTPNLVVTLPTETFTTENIGQSMYVGNITGPAVAIPNRYTISNVNGQVVTFTVTGWTGTAGTCSLFGWNYHHILYDGATETAAKYDAQRMGWNSTDTTLTIATTRAPGHIIQIMNDDGMSMVSDSVTTSLTTQGMTQRGSRLINLPDSGINLYLQLRAVCSSVTPVANTWVVGMISMEEFAPVPVVIESAKQTGFGGIGVTVLSAPSTTVTGTVTANIGTGAIAAGTNAIGDVGIQYRATATGAATINHYVTTAGTNARLVKNAAGRVLGWNVTNATSAYRYVKLTNTVSAPTPGTTAVVTTIGVPPNTINVNSTEGGLGFATGISYYTTSAIAETPSTSADTVGATDMTIDIYYA